MNQNIETSAQSLRSLVKLTRGMSQIEADSDRIVQIIKSIDEIAFQTNLLALNAAVEAARAGEAGTGFAVVAGEVRNLAMRAKEAARNTQELLDTTIERIRQSAVAIKTINTDFGGIIESATVMGEKTAAISRAAEEQSGGIVEISKAGKRMDEVTHQVASSAEESTAAAEELHAQAETLKEYANDLAVLVGRSGRKTPKLSQKGAVERGHKDVMVYS